MPDGNTSPNYTVNNDIRLYWDFNDQNDEVNNVQLNNAAGLSSTYGRCDTSGVFKTGTSITSMYASNVDVAHSPQDSFSTVLWYSTHDDQKDSGCYSFSKYDTGQENTINENAGSFRSSLERYSEGQDAASGRFRVDIVRDGIGLEAPILEEFVEASRWNMYYAGRNGEFLESSVNGRPKSSGFTDRSFINSGNYLLGFQEGIIDEVRTYDRPLSDDELSYLYNWGFPQPIHREKSKRQYLYPSRNSQTQNISSGYYIVPNMNDFWTNLISFSGLVGDAVRFTHKELWYATPAMDAIPYSSTFSPINQWHTPYASETPEDREALIISDDVTAHFSWEMGPMFVNFSSVTLHVKGCTMPRRGETNPSEEEDVHAGLLPERKGFIDNIAILDASGLIISDIPVTDGFLLGYSGYYDSDEPYIYYSSGLQMLPPASSHLYDLSTTYMGFHLTHSGTYSSSTELDAAYEPGTKTPYPVLYGVALEINGEENIAETGVGIEGYIDLYTEGAESVNSGIDLYTTAAYFENSGIDLYTYGHSIETSSIPMYALGSLATNSGIDLYLAPHDSLAFSNSLFIHGFSTDNSGMDLYTNGVLVDNSGIDFYTYGKSSDNSGMELFMTSFLTDNSGMDLYVSGIGRPTSGINLFVWGKDTKNSGIDLSVWGHLSTNSGIDLWTEGVDHSSGGMPFFLQATVNYSSGGFPLYVNSTTNTSVYKACPMYLEVNDNATDTGSMPLFLNSVTTGSGDQYMPFYLESHADSLTKGTDMYLQNAFASGSKSQFLYVKGLGGLVGGSVDNGSMPLFIERIEGVEKGLSMYLGVNSGDEQGVNMYTFGGTWSNSGVDLVIPSTIDSKNSGINIYVNGL